MPKLVVVRGQLYLPLQGFVVECQENASVESRWQASILQ